MKVLIRQATVDDLPDVLSLYAQPDMDNHEVTTLKKATQIFEQFSNIQTTACMLLTIHLRITK
jgi:hypothetical protein